jgi:hypothetical protein
MALSGPYGILRLVDQNMRNFDNGVSVYYVQESYSLNDFEFTEIGLSYTPPITGGNDLPNPQPIQTLIAPPPQVSSLSARQIADAQKLGMALREGARKFTISDTWVQAQVASMALADPRQLWYSQYCRGIQYLNTLYQVVTGVPNDGMGGLLSWDVLCNAPLPS